MVIRIWKKPLRNKKPAEFQMFNHHLVTVVSNYGPTDTEEKKNKSGTVAAFH